MSFAEAKDPLLFKLFILLLLEHDKSQGSKYEPRLCHFDRRHEGSAGVGGQWQQEDSAPLMLHVALIIIVIYPSKFLVLY